LKTKKFFLTQAEIGYMHLMAEKLKHLSQEETLLEINSDRYESLKKDLINKYFSEIKITAHNKR